MPQPKLTSLPLYFPSLPSSITGGLGSCRISPPGFLAESGRSPLNQGSFVLLYFVLFNFSGLYLVTVAGHFKLSAVHLVKIIQRE